jgi:hypothetical protein
MNQQGRFRPNVQHSARMLTKCADAPPRSNAKPTPSAWFYRYKLVDEVASQDTYRSLTPRMRELQA